MYNSTLNHAANSIADFRSDTVTQPTEAMRAAMMDARLGDDVYGDDPSVNALEAKAAAMLGKDAALLLTSGTQSNLAGVMAHCGRGDEFLIGSIYHVMAWEAMGTAVLGSIASTALPVDANGSLNEADIVNAIKPDDFHMAATRLLSIENTVNGMVQPLEYMDKMAEVAHGNGLALHCDGARLMNAAVALGVPAERLVRGCDTVSLCLSKGLGAPVGSVLAGDKETIARARRIRKMLGGGMRQAGMLAAAAMHALDHHVDRLAEDHARARQLAAALNDVAGIEVDLGRTHTNMVFLAIDPSIDLAPLEGFLADRGIAINPDKVIRLVIHLDLDDDDCDRLVSAMKEFTGK